MNNTSAPAPPSSNQRLAALSLGALGVVFGDIGTSPLYALRECFRGAHGMPITPESVVGILSLIIWSLVIVISIKYVAFVMRADNQGEGGVLALVTLVASAGRHGRELGPVILGAGIFGAGLLYGDGMITPAISVLSAVEGLEVMTPALEPFVMPMAIAILIGLFVLQRHGTGTIGRVFGPVMVLWFGCLALLGVRSIVETPEVLAGLSPIEAARFMARNGLASFFVLSAVFLVVTGGEALYADMGHFGRRPIRAAWFSLVLPALILNYFGQGALLIRQPAAAESPFYRLAPEWGLLPLVVLATVATVIASQAVISGAFSLARQAMQLGYSPRIEIRHSSPEEIGQVYAPLVNWVLLAATIGLVLGFGSSDGLAGAYGVAVSTTMVITTVLAYRYVRLLWGWSILAGAVVAGSLLIVDLAFFVANLAKIDDGGWFPLLVALIICPLMVTWHRGRWLLSQRIEQRRLAVDMFLTDVAEHPPTRVPGTAVFMDSNPTGVPTTLLHNLKHNHVLHERVILMTIVTEPVPYVSGVERLHVEPLAAGITRVVGHYGYLETPSVPALLHRLGETGLRCDPMEATFFVGRETLVIRGKYGMARWRKRLFNLMLHNALDATRHFRLPPTRVVEIGAEVEL